MDLSSFVKTQDPNHLVTVGEEGFYGPGSPDVGQNPTPGTGQWCSLTGEISFYQSTYKSCYKAEMSLGEKLQL